MRMDTEKQCGKGLRRLLLTTSLLMDRCINSEGKAETDTKGQQDPRTLIAAAKYSKHFSRPIKVTIIAITIISSKSD